MPALPEGWSAEVVLRSAGGASFSGDFLVATRSDDGQHAGGRARRRLRQGRRRRHPGAAAVGRVRRPARLGPARGLPAGDQPLPAPPAVGGGVRDGRPRDHRPGRRGSTSSRSAGHPPAVQFAAGSGRWRVSEASEGPLLGIFPDAKFVSGARPPGPRRRAAAVHRRADREARPGHLGRHRQAARRGRAAGHQGLPARRPQADRPGRRRPQRRPGRRSHLARLTASASVSLLQAAPGVADDPHGQEGVA